MKSILVRLVMRGCIVACLAQVLGSMAFATTMSVSDWTGAFQTAAPSNFGPQSTAFGPGAGGTFEERITPLERNLVDAGQFSDPSLEGGPYGFLDNLSMSGIVTFNTNVPTVDTTVFFGWYNGNAID